MTYFIYIIYKLNVFLVMFIEHLLILPLCLHCLSRYEALEKLREHSNEVANDRPSPEIFHDSRAVSRAPTRVCDVEGGAVCSKNSTFGYFDGAAWTPRFRSPTPIMATPSTQ